MNLALALTLSLLAQSGQLVTYGTGAPTGYCNKAYYVDAATGQNYACVGNAWQATTIIPTTKSSIGLGNVDNTSDASKPVSTAQQTALNLKANLASPAFTGTVTGITKAMVGLTNVDDTSDANKPVSSAQQTALNLKAPLASPTFSGTVTGVTAAMVGLGNVNNTSDAGKPVSTAQQSALDLKANLSSPSLVTPNIGAATGTSLATTGSITSNGDGIGYATGAGGTVTQSPNKSSAVTLNKLTGEITMNNAALAAAAIVSFTLTDSFIAAKDVLILNHVTTGTRGAYGLNAQCQAGSAIIYVRNNTAGSLSEAIVLRFVLVKAVAN
jgi:hypothetical protein